MFLSIDEGVFALFLFCRTVSFFVISRTFRSVGFLEKRVDRGDGLSKARAGTKGNVRLNERREENRNEPIDREREREEERREESIEYGFSTKRGASTSIDRSES